MGTTYLAGNLINPGDLRLLGRDEGAGKRGQIMNPNRRYVSQTAPTASQNKNHEIRYLYLKSGSAETWFGLGFALAEGTPFIAAVNEEDLPDLFSMANRLGVSFPGQGPLFHGDSREDWACLASTETMDRELDIAVLETLESKDQFQGFGSLKSQLRSSLGELKALTPTLESLLERGFVQIHYERLGNEEISETYRITPEGLTWLKKIREAEDATPLGALSFAD